MGNIRDLALDEDGDIAVVNGDFATVADAEAVKQGCAIRVRMFTGDCWLDEAQGEPWIDQVFSVKDPDPLVVRELGREALADTPDVVDVASSELVNDGVTREAAVAYAVADVYGSPLTTRTVELPQP